MQQDSELEQINTAATESSLPAVLEFINRLFESLAWPIVILAIALLFRKELKNVASNLKRLKWGDAEAVFDESVAEAKAAARTLDPVESETASKNDKQTLTLMQKAEVSPTGAVIEAYKGIEEKLVHIAHVARDEIFSNSGDKLKQWSTKRMPISVIARALLESGWLTNSEMVMLEKLRETRNLAAHSSESVISTQSAKEFVRLAGALDDALQSKIDQSLSQN